MPDFISLLHRLEGNLFDVIYAGKFEMSIQASYSHYCSPRKTLKPYLYDEFEVLIRDLPEQIKKRTKS